MQTGTDVLHQICSEPPLSTGLLPLDTLLHGGLTRDLVTLLIGNPKINAQILQQIALEATVRLHQTHPETTQKILYVDGANRFNPYHLSQLAIHHGVAAQTILSTILVSRAFNWSNMVETVAENLDKVADTPIDMIVVSGLTKFFEEEAVIPRTDTASPQLRPKAFEGLNAMCAGLKRLQAKHHTRILLSTTLNTKSTVKPAGGHILTHFANVIIRMLPYLKYLFQVKFFLFIFYPP
ncbi:DNA repair and recombination protein RadA [Candidatus Lokiarchaeum ossiferum]|uniref:DNA repair and recombination protein RadA n=1 Tax=Candidatus Lokiarchaeum ossiferum TaxID=2951803 RepID=A0ABY6HYI2_9ARCH|nr:DNA repair and recombination protein RadA [Candidatus Lokiarchaeum sp. B-35]